MNFSLMFFAASEDTTIKDKYNLIIESAKYADKNGFSSIWVPERHFIKFGYLYPNPAVLHSALARETNRVGLRAGSVVMPLHNPIRVAEDWAVVDNLSGGRIGISFAPGWNPDDFAFHPEKYKERHKEMYAGIDKVRTLWEGGSINVVSGNGKNVDISTYPKPIQEKLPIWITASGNPESFIKAGDLGANLLTHILDQDAQQLGKKIALYKEALAKNGFDPNCAQITVMIHTFLGENSEEIRELAREPYCEYMKANKNIFSGLAQSRGKPI
jgi:phthiocerol/phenolphthiocerol synthesis type-I polyketide synthase D